MNKYLMIAMLAAFLCVANICHAEDVWVNTYYDIEYYVDTDSIKGFKDDFGVFLNTRNIYNGDTWRFQMAFTKYDDLHIFTILRYEDGDYGGCGYVRYDEDGPVTNTFFYCIKQIDKAGGRL